MIDYKLRVGATYLVQDMVEKPPGGGPTSDSLSRRPAWV